MKTKMTFVEFAQRHKTKESVNVTFTTEDNEWIGTAIFNLMFSTMSANPSGFVNFGGTCGSITLFGVNTVEEDYDEQSDTTAITFECSDGHTYTFISAQ